MTEFVINQAAKILKKRKIRAMWKGNYYENFVKEAFEGEWRGY